MDSNTITLRAATLADVDVIVQLSDELFQEDARQHAPLVNLEWARQHGRAHFTELIGRATAVCFLAEVDGAAVGYLAGYIHGPSDYRPVITAELQSMFVRGPWRSKAVGSELVVAFTAWAVERGAVRLTVSAFAANERAIAFYKRAGFVPHEVTLERLLEE